METTLGVTFNDFVILAADRYQSFSIMMLQDESSKIYLLGTHLAMSVTGDPGDTTQFAEYVQRNLELEKFRDGFEVTPNRAFHWTRHQLATSIRSRSPYNVFPLMAGYDVRQNKSKLYYLDYLGAGVEVPYTGHGYGEPFATGLLDRHHRPDLDETQAIKLVHDALDAIDKRLIVEQKQFELIIIDKDGVRKLPDYKANNS